MADDVKNLTSIQAETKETNQSCGEIEKVDAETSQIHLAHQFARWGKYEKFSRDSEFKKRCEVRRQMLIDLMMHCGSR